MTNTISSLLLASVASDSNRGWDIIGILMPLPQPSNWLTHTVTCLMNPFQNVAVIWYYRRYKLLTHREKPASCNTVLPSSLVLQWQGLIISCFCGRDWVFMEILFVPFGMGAAHSGATVAGLCPCPRRLLLPITPSVSGAYTVQLSWDSQKAYRVPGTWLDTAEVEMAAWTHLHLNPGSPTSWLCLNKFPDLSKSISSWQNGDVKCCEH